MPLYYYQALEPGGKKRKGMIEAFDIRDAKGKLKEQGIFLTRLSSKGSYFKSQGMKIGDLSTFTTLLCQLVSSGIPLYESLLAIEEQYRGTKLNRIVSSLADQVKGGVKLSLAMGAFPESFDPLYRSMVAAGESSGALEEVLNKLTLLLIKKEKLKKEINTALIYPSILGAFALLVIGMLLGFVIPSIEGIFEGRKLNSFTHFIIQLSLFARTWWWLYIPSILGLGFLFYYQMKKPSVKEKVLSFMLRVPLIGKVMVEAAMSRFTRTLATLLQGGLPLIEALRYAKGTLQNPVLEHDISLAEGKIIEGNQLSYEMAKSRFIPKLVPRMVAIGEDTGHLSSMLNKVADIYEEELDKTLKRTMALIQPVILLIMGAIIGLILIAVLLPLTDLSNLS